MSFFVSLILLFIIGTAFGSFLNVWILRSHKKASVMCGRSRCSSCKRVILFRDLVPIICFFVLHGRCRFCRTPISLQYPLVEAWMGLAFLGVGFWFQKVSIPRYSLLVIGSPIGDWLSVGILLFVIFFLTFIFVSDLRFMEIPLHATLTPALVFFLFASMLDSQKILPMLFGIAMIAGFFFLQYLVSRGAWIGLGDVWAGVFAGVVLGEKGGVRAALLGLTLAYVVGALIAIVSLIFFKKKIKDRIPFGPFIALGTLGGLLII